MSKSIRSIVYVNSMIISVLIVINISLVGTSISLNVYQLISFNSEEHSAQLKAERGNVEACLAELRVMQEEMEKLIMNGGVTVPGVVRGGESDTPPTPHPELKHPTPPQEDQLLQRQIREKEEKRQEVLRQEQERKQQEEQRLREEQVKKQQEEQLIRVEEQRRQQEEQRLREEQERIKQQQEEQRLREEQERVRQQQEEQRRQQEEHHQAV